MCSAVAFEESVLAPMTIPGILTKCETFVAVRPRIEVCETEEWRSSWWPGSALDSSKSSSLREGYRMRCVQVFKAASNWHVYQ